MAGSGLPVLIEGACGTGKEALAERIHELSGNSDGLVRVLCRQSGLSFQAPGAQNGSCDLSHLYRSSRGTLFLKNVHLLSAAAQEQFLTTLEQTADEFDGKEGPPVARLISTAAEPLEPFVTRREFNAALYYRLSVYRVSLPLLRERVSDIPELFAQMVRRVANGNGAAPPVPARLTEMLAAYDWPGNLRELRNVARTYVVTGDAEEIIAELGGRLHQSKFETPAVAPSGGVKLSLKEQVRGASQKLESEIILRTLERHRWNRRRAAESLQISYRSLLYKMKNCNLRMEPQGVREGD